MKKLIAKHNIILIYIQKNKTTTNIQTK